MVIPKITDETAVISLSTAQTAFIDRRAIDRALAEGAGNGSAATPPDLTDTAIISTVAAARKNGARANGSGPARRGRTAAYDTPTGAKRYFGRHGRDVPRALRLGVRATGEVMVTVGLVLLLFAAYEVWGTALIVNGHQNDLNAQLEQQWAQGDDPTVQPTTGPGTLPGDGENIGQAAGPTPVCTPIARLYLPRLNKYWAVVEGVDTPDLKCGPGHYPGTAMPGQTGNFAVAGHRISAVFWNLDLMRPGDAVVVETKDTWYIYRVTEQLVVVPTAVEVVAPVPEQPGATPTDAMLTMTTCNPKFNNYQRLVVHAKLDHTQPHDAGRPPELNE
jgi:sortase A